MFPCPGCDGADDPLLELPDGLESPVPSSAGPSRGSPLLGLLAEPESRTPALAWPEPEFALLERLVGLDFPVLELSRAGLESPLFVGRGFRGSQGVTLASSVPASPPIVAQ